MIAEAAPGVTVAYDDLGAGEPALLLLTGWCSNRARWAGVAALAAERMGAKVCRIYDVGVAGLHRLMKHLDVLKSSRAVVVAAGMEGALPSVVGGLIDRPIVAVPTSVGYSMNLKGVAALLAMLNTCVPGISVVNIDNGFGAGVSAALINRVAEGTET